MPDLSAADWAFINLLRMAALRCRAAARTDLFEACAILTMQPDAAKRAYTDSLVGTLREALGKQAIFFRPGVSELSFDERWLVALAQAHDRSDLPSFRFMIAARVHYTARRNLAYLVAALADDKA